jgi:hypothetical protein
MAFWVCAYCHRPVGSVTPAALRDGIATRLRSLTYLFCPEDEENPDAVLARLRITAPVAGATFQRYELHYRPGPTWFLLAERFPDRGSADEVDAEILAPRDEAGETDVTAVRDLLVDVTETVSIGLKPHDVRGMGFPLAIAAAATLVERAGGVIRSGSYSWMLPSGSDVRILSEFES